MIRKVIKVDKNKCVGCALCVNACHEGAIGMVDGKATLLRDDYCDGLGNCLPVCPTDAITFEEREAEAYNRDVAPKRVASEKVACACPGSMSKSIKGSNLNEATTTSQENVPSMLNQWPVQIKLVPPKASYFENATLLVAADCTAFAYGNFHADYMKNKVTIIGCPKLDDGSYAEKLTEILKHNNIKSVTVARMEVPCCRGIENDVKTALQNCQKMIPWQVVTISLDGKVLD